MGFTAVNSYGLNELHKQITHAMETLADTVDAYTHIQRLEQIPLLAEMQALLEAVNDEEVDVNELAKLVETSPGVAARVVGIANSAYYGSGTTVASVAEAIIRVLGLKTVRKLVIGLAASATFQPENCPGFDTEQYWSSALLTAYLARRLAGVVAVEPAPDPDNAYLCGLLHNVGLIALVHVSANEMAQVFLLASKYPQKPLPEIESEILGVNHYEAGALLATRWGLPEEVQTAIAHQETLEYHEQHWPLCRLIGLCAHWTRQCLSGVEDPSLEADTIMSLQMDIDDMQARVAAAYDEVQSILDLAKLFVS